MSKRYDSKALIAVAVTLVFWASAFAFIKVGLRSYHPANLAFLRFSVASIALAIYGAITGIRLPHKQDLPGIALMGFLGITVYHLALNFGTQTVSAGSASFLVGAAPIITALLAMAFLGERMRLAGWFGTIISFAGVGLIALGQGKGLQFSPGALLILLSALCTSVYFIIQKRYLNRYNAFEITTYGIWLGTIFMLPFAGGSLAQLRAASLASTLAAVYLGIFPAALAYVTWAYALSRMTASQTANYLFLSPLLATLIAWLLIGETPSLVAALGGLLVLAGVIVVNRQGR